jgi:phosphoenolpyruvate synthase/pyruvate phosphate dikinase
MDVLWLGHADCHDLNRAGAKAAHLSRLASGYRIPPGFCVSAESYCRWAEFLDSGRPTLTSASLPLALSNALVSAYQDLAQMCGVAEPSVAVRSSAIDEDGSTHSFAGQHETYLNIVGAHTRGRGCGSVLELGLNGTHPGVPATPGLIRRGRSCRRSGPAACPGRRVSRGVQRQPHDR